MESFFYTVRIDGDAEHALRKFPKQDRTRISENIETLARDPRPDGCKKIKGMENLYRIRVGDYRVVYSIQDRILLVLVIRIARRKDVYRNISKLEPHS